MSTFTVLLWLHDSLFESNAIKTDFFSIYQTFST